MVNLVNNNLYRFLHQNNFHSSTDIIFFIFLYQRWIYRVDPSRVNEFGVSQQMLEERQNAVVPSDSNAPAIEGAASDEAVSTPLQAKPLEEKKNE